MKASIQMTKVGEASGRYFLSLQAFLIKRNLPLFNELASGEKASPFALSRNLIATQAKLAR